jgi:hypothetical protein
MLMNLWKNCAAGAVALALIVSAGLAVPLAQQAVPNDAWCDDENWSRDREGVCEVREFTVPMPNGPVTVDAAPNGGITVEGGTRSDVLVRARVVATAATEDRAREIVNAVRVNQDGAQIRAEGPDQVGRREGWHVTYRVAVPNQAGLALKTTNGGISIKDVEGAIDFRTTNGGVKLAGLAGQVTGRTTNGGITVDLEGQTWRGEGLDVETTNGGVRLAIPAQYSARLDAATSNGGLRVDFPVTVQGRIGRDVQADLGAGGPPIRVRTSNGGVNVVRK